MTAHNLKITGQHSELEVDDKDNHHHKRYCYGLLKYFILSLVVIMVSYPFLILNFFKMPISTDWAHGAYGKKTEAALSVKDPKIIFAGGSATHFGINAEKVTTALGIPAINYGVMAILDLNYIIHRVKKVVKPGDLIVMPLEYCLYEYNSQKSYNLQKKYYLLTYEHKFFLESLSSLSFLKEVYSIDPLEVLKSFYEQVRAKSKVLSISRIYSVDSINNYGDLTDSISHKLKELKPIFFLNKQDYPTDESMEILRSFKDWCKKNKISLLITFPNTAMLTAYEEQDYVRFMDKFLAFLKGEGFNVLGHPRDAMVDPKYIYDSTYHLTNEGIDIRTRKLIQRLKNRVSHHDKGVFLK